MLVRLQNGSVRQFDTDTITWTAGLVRGVYCVIYHLPGKSESIVFKTKDQELSILILERVFETMKAGLDVYDFYQGPLSEDARSFKLNEKGKSEEVGISDLMEGALDDMVDDET